MENCLLEQIFIKDPDQKKKIRDLIAESVARLGENIIIRRFVRFQLGETAKAMN
jgi:elongation factor Ts